jgi:diketogulonate reductase-like aldo/keto reductase
VNTQEAKLRDAMRGAMWEEKWRETLEEYRSPDLLRVSARRWLEYPKISPVPNNDWNLPSLGLGTYGWKYNSQIMEEALRLGVGLIDTAEGYGFGKVEKELGKVLKEIGYETWIATKVARNHLSETATISAGKRSRENLGRIDLYQIHWPNPLAPLEKTLDAMTELLSQKVIDRVGVCNFCGGQLVRAIRLARERGFEIVSNQVRLNTKDRGNTEFLIPFCESLNVRVIAYSSLGQGSLRKEASESLEWVIDQSGVSVALFRTNSIEHLRDNLSVGKRTK